MTEAALETVDVSCVFRVNQGFMKGTKPLRAVNGVSLKIPKGQVVGLVGESGCGKSTLANILLGLQAPTEGDVLYDGKSAASFTRKDIARRIQPIFQDPYSSLNPTKTIHSIVSLPLRIHNVGDPAEIDRKVYDIPDLTGFTGSRTRTGPCGQRSVQAQKIPVASGQFNRVGEAAARRISLA